MTDDNKRHNLVAQRVPIDSVGRRWRQDDVYRIPLQLVEEIEAAITC
jgi:hypothetical protein